MGSQVIYVIQKNIQETKKQTGFRLETCQHSFLFVITNHFYKEQHCCRPLSFKNSAYNDTIQTAFKHNLD